MIESVRLVLQPGLIDQQQKEKLWAKTKSKRSFYVGFLHAAADDLPIEVDAHKHYEAVIQQLKPLLDEKNAYALMLEKVLSDKGQAFIDTAEQALKKPGNQDVVVSLLAAIANYFSGIVPETFSEDDIVAICAEAETLCCANHDEINKVVSALEGSVENVQQYFCAMTVLSCLSVNW